MVDIRKPLSCDEAMNKLKAIYAGNEYGSSKSFETAYNLVCKIYSRQNNYVYERSTKKMPDNVAGTDEEAKHKILVELPFLQYRLNMACLLADNMKADMDIAIAAIVGPAFKCFYRNDAESTKKEFGDIMYKRICVRLQGMESAVGTAFFLADKCYEIDEMLFDLTVSEMYTNLLGKLYDSRRPQAAYVKNAFKLAATAHAGVHRQSGEPYIVHPLMVARILADADAESEIVAAAILHDVLEDSDYTIDDINAISSQIGRYVDAVTSVDKEYEAYKQEKIKLGEHFDEESKAELDRKTVSKLRSLAAVDESMIFAVYIKAADRIHNLKTIDGMPADKRRKKLSETEEYYLPIFREFGLNDFVYEIEDQVWRTACIGTDNYETVKTAYSKLLKKNTESIRSATKYVNDIANEGVRENCSLFSLQSFNAKISTNYFYPYQIYSLVDCPVRSEMEKSVSKKKIPLCSFDVVSEGSNASWDVILFAKLFIKAFNDQSKEIGSIISDFQVEPINKRNPEKKRVKLTIEDKYCARMIINIYDKTGYYIYRNGSSKGIWIPEDGDAADAEENQIKIITPKDKVIELPKGATPLDFAFKIHNEIGMYARGASINNSNFSKDMLFQVLEDGDKVEIDYDVELAKDYGGRKCEGAFAKIEWLNHVKTSQARHFITRWLHEKYESD